MGWTAFDSAGASAERLLSVSLVLTWSWFNVFVRHPDKNGQMKPEDMSRTRQGTLSRMVDHRTGVPPIAVVRRSR